MTNIEYSIALNFQRKTIHNAKAALGLFGYGVYVVGARRGDELNAMTARFVSQVSTRPPRLSLTIRRRSLTNEFIQESGVFSISVLARGQELLAGHFGLRSGRQARKFCGIEYSMGESGAPFLNDCCAVLECRVESAHGMGNMVLLVGEIVRTSHGTLCNEPPLRYRKEDYFG